MRPRIYIRGSVRPSVRRSVTTSLRRLRDASDFEYSALLLNAERLVQRLANANMKMCTKNWNKKKQTKQYNPNKTIQNKIKTKPHSTTFMPAPTGQKGLLRKSTFPPALNVQLFISRYSLSTHGNRVNQVIYRNGIRFQSIQATSRVIGLVCRSVAHLLFQRLP